MTEEYAKIQNETVIFLREINQKLVEENERLKKEIEELKKEVNNFKDNDTKEEFIEKNFNDTVSH